MRKKKQEKIKAGKWKVGYFYLLQVLLRDEAVLVEGDAAHFLFDHFRRMANYLEGPLCGKLGEFSAISYPVE